MVLFTCCLRYFYVPFTKHTNNYQLGGNCNLTLVSLSNAINYDHTLIGSKAMNLSKIKTILNNIPDGYVVTSEAFKEFLSFNNIKTTNNKKVQDEIINAKFPISMEFTIAEKFETMKK